MSTPQHKARVLAAAPELHMVVDVADGTQEVVFVGDWVAAQERCAALQNRVGFLEHGLDFMVRSTRDPQWQHLVEVGRCAARTKRGELVMPYEAAARLNYVVKRAGQVDTHSAGGWFYRDGKPFRQGSDALFRLRACALVNDDDTYYGIVGIKGGINS